MERSAICDDGRPRDEILEELEQLYRVAPVGLCLVDRELRFRRVNEHLAAINGVPVDAHLGRTVREVIPEIADAVETRYRKVLETGYPILDTELTAALPSSSWEHTYLVSDHPFLGKGGDVEGVVTVVQDITQLKQVESRWLEMRDRLAEAQQVADLASYEWNLETGDAWWSRHMYRLTGQERGRFVPGPDAFFELVHPDDRGKFRQQLETIFAAPEQIHVSEYRILREGEVRVVQSTACLERGREGRPPRVIGTVQDVTDRSRPESDLAHEVEELRDLLAERTHEAESLRRLLKGTAMEPSSD